MQQTSDAKAPTNFQRCGTTEVVPFPSPALLISESSLPVSGWIPRTRSVHHDGFTVVRQAKSQARLFLQNADGNNLVAGKIQELNGGARRLLGKSLP